MPTLRAPRESLLFELSHPQRRAILEHLESGPLRLTSISHRIHTPPPETHRHLRRLVGQALLERRPDGRFELTPYGRVVMEVTSPAEFLVAHREFLRTHDLTVLPLAFLHRLSDLSDTGRGSTFAETLRHSERVLERAKQFVLFMTDQTMLSEERTREIAGRARIPIRAIVPRGILPPTARVRDAYAAEEPSSGLVVRVLPAVRLGLAMNERLAGVCFPDREGKIDFSAGFNGDSQRVVGWCRDLFEHHWAQAAPVRF